MKYKNKRHLPPLDSISVLSLQLACKTQRESRAMEICELMPTQHAVQLAVKYATRLRFMQLATQLNELAHRKAAEEMEEEEEEEEPVYVAPRRPVNRLVNGACCPGISLSMRSANERRHYIVA